jgi:hypothetical protein
MAFLATFCDECQRPALLDEQKASEGGLTCPQCGGAAQVIPGCSFNADDGALFNDLCQVVAEGRLLPSECRALSRAVDQALRTGSPGRLLAELTERLPGLIPTQVGAGSNANAHRRALLLLRAILDATARSRRSTRPPPQA